MLTQTLRLPEWPGWLYLFLIPLLALLVTMVLVSVLALISSVNPASVIYYLIVDPLNSRVAFVEVLVKATPLLLTGVAVALAFSASYWNIGAEGQLYAGAVLSTWLGIHLHGWSPWLGIPLMVLAGMAGGALWALPPAWLKTRWDVDEVVTTLLLNPVMIFFVGALLNGPWRDPISQWPQSPEVARAAQFPSLLTGMRLHMGFFVALLALAFYWWLMSRTSLGLSIRATGQGSEAARFMGVKVKRVTLLVALLSGAIAGLAGASLVAGLHFHLIEQISANYGYTGIVVATLGGLRPVGVGLAAWFIGLIEIGAHSVSRALNVPVYLGQVVQATFMLVVLGMLLLRRFGKGRTETRWI